MIESHINRKRYPPENPGANQEVTEFEQQRQPIHNDPGRLRQANGRTGGSSQHRQVGDIQAAGGGPILRRPAENAEYAAAKEEQAKLETRISRLEFQLGNARILNSNSLDASRVTLGTTVTIEDIVNSQNYSYMIVGSEESDPRSNRISSSSPVGQALLNKTVGDEVHVKVPRGVRHLKVVSISVTG